MYLHENVLMELSAIYSEYIYAKLKEKKESGVEGRYPGYIHA